jgi:hypothetical protein
MHNVNLRLIVVLCGTAILLTASQAAPPKVIQKLDEPEEMEYEEFVKHMQNEDEPLTDEEMAMLYEMEARQQASSEEEERPVELEVEPEESADSNEEEAPVVAKEEKPTKEENDAREKKMKLTGEREYATFTDPAFAASAMRSQQAVVDVKRYSDRDLHFSDMNQLTMNGNMIFIGVVGICAVVAMVGTVVAGVAYYKLHAQAQAAKEINPAAFAKDRRHVTSAIRGQTARGDQKNAYSAQLHHYQQTKSEIIRMEQAGQAVANERAEGSDESDAEVDEADYSVYECPGLAPTGDIEVANPMFTNQSGAEKK